MNVFSLVIYSLFVAFGCADFGVIYQTPTGNITINTTQASIQINQTVNRPTFSTFIRFYNASISLIDVSSNTSNVTYINNTLTFNIPSNLSNTIYITFDAGVFFSNSSVNSTARNDPNFWQLTLVSSVSTTTTTTTTTTTILTTSSNTTITTTTATLTASNNTTITTTTAILTTSNNTTTTTTLTTFTGSTTTSNTTTTVTIGTTTTTSTTANTTVTRESPPTRSAQIGMALGIIFISVIIIIEIIYFKYCYSGAGRSSSYFT